MKLAVPLLCILTFFTSATAQSPAELQKQFLAQLNSILRSSPQHHWAYEGEKMKIDSPFAVSREGLISVTLQYSTDTTSYKVRYTAPLNSIKKVVQDVYLILEYSSDAMIAYKKERGSNEWQEILRRNYFHIGVMGENPLRVEDVRHTLALLLQNKELSPDEYFFRDYTVEDKQFSEGLKAVERDGKFGFMNLKREIAIGFQFDEANEFAEGLAAVRKGEKWGFINAKGTLVIPCTYKAAYDFEEGKAQVFIKGKWFYIDKNGKNLGQDGK
jgi:hypothetical protein